MSISCQKCICRHPYFFIPLTLFVSLITLHGVLQYFETSLSSPGALKEDDLYKVISQTLNKTSHHFNTTVVQRNFISSGQTTPPLKAPLLHPDWSFVSGFLDYRQYPRVVISIYAVRRTNAANTKFKCKKLFSADDKWEMNLNETAVELTHYNHGNTAGDTRTLRFGPFHMNRHINPSSNIQAHLESSATKTIIRLKLTFIPPLANISAKYQFSICLSPMFGNVSVERFIHFVEMTRILGADHFFIYDYGAGSLNPLMKKVWNYYETQNQSIISVTPWTLPPFYTDNEVYYHLQVLHLQLCLHRAITESAYTMFYDLDEILVPTIAATWSDLVREINFNGSDDRCSICFPMSYFKGQGANNLKQSIYFTDFLPTNPNAFNGKCLTRTAYLYEMHIHNARSCIEGYRHIAAPSSIALIHHYYDHYCLNPSHSGYFMCQSSNLNNTKLLKHERTFYQRVMSVKQQLGIHFTQ